MAEKLSLTRDEARLAVEWEHKDFDVARKEPICQDSFQTSYHVVLKRKSDEKYFQDFYAVPVGSLPFWNHDPNFTEVLRKETIMVEWVPVR